MIRAIEVYEATCDACGYFGDPQADNEVPDGWEVRSGTSAVRAGLIHLCPECAS